MQKTVLLFLSFFVFGLLPAQNWDVIRNSGDYYYGVGQGKTEAEAADMALSELVNMIAVNVTNEFVGLTDETQTNDGMDFQSKVLNCVKTYSQSTLTNVEKWVIGKEPDVTVRHYMKRSELQRIFEERKAKALDMLEIAQEAQEIGKIDMALQYYYWAYTLIRSLQHPNEVENAEGQILMNWLPLKIDEILSKVDVKMDKQDGDYVDLKFTYDGQPVSSLEYTYSDGRAECQGMAKDGSGMMEMAPGYDTDYYHIHIEYQFKGQARGDAEMYSVLNVVPQKMFKHAAHVLKNQGGQKSRPAVAEAPVQAKTSAKNTSVCKLSSADILNYNEKLNQVMSAIQSKVYSNATSLFTLNGLDVYNQLIAYGKGRIVGQPEFVYTEGPNGTVTARGLQMSFSFKNGNKKTFVEDVAFTFNARGKIENIAFGLGKQATEDILFKYAPGWTPEIRELLIEFLENYKTAYSLKRLDYINTIYADDAVIIIGHVAKVLESANRPTDGYQVSMAGQDKITYNRMKKNDYLGRLAACFKRNEFINIRFSNNDIQRLEKYDDKEMYAIQIGQEYNSSSYSDKGYLFLLVDMSNSKQPLIRIRTWQPNEVSMEKLYNAGDFYDE